MKRKLLIVLCITVVFVLLSGCSGGPDFCDPSIEHGQEHTVLPFNDGMFILTPYDFETRWASFVFSEGFEHRLYRGIYHHVQYRATISYSHATEFLNIMNNFSPVLVSSIVTEGRDDSPFEELTYDNYLYFFLLNHIPNRTFTLEPETYPDFCVHMRAYQTDEYGLLYFSMFGSKTTQYPTHSYVSFSNMTHHSLYRITLDELGEFIQFAESLERYRLDGHGHPMRPIPLLRRLLNRLGIPMRLWIPVVVGVPIIACVGTTVIIVLIVRRCRKKKANTSVVQEETDNL
ncbi:MAG: hypothetical protein FWC96_03920 [Oscillospiraceae bacterium]|nr:hypothetical protein [Oscillospiraceae bacterium]